ncbi:MAG TPA: class I SAM-dependent methyltransferase [Candidatus Saccharimonadales bacterium]|nr:class I SAM-dependent methyltransferase [Candidatus Saccharimonadales bacterium]
MPPLRRRATTLGTRLGRFALGRRAERFLLERIWSGAPAEMLDTYLVSGFQDPSINMQSILLRHFLVHRLVGDRLDPLMREEIAFAIGLNEELRTTAAALGVTMRTYLDPAKAADVRRVDAAITDRRDVFQRRWTEALRDEDLTHISVIELACGSANDYRAFADYGIAPYLDYLGIDLTPKNIENARRRFPEVSFAVGDITAVAQADRAADYVIASDIYEHLSLDAMERALDETLRLARQGVALTFFNMRDVPEHDSRPRGLYFWNLLSSRRIRSRLEREFRDVQVVPVAAWLAAEHDCTQTYNPNAVSMFAVGRG